MATGGHPHPAAGDANGAAMAAVLGSGIGALAMGAFVLANEAGAFAAPALYAPAGGVTGRTAFAAITWLIAWGLLHWRWAGRSIAPRRVLVLTLALIGAGILGTFPPLWGVLF
jgi:hypothetical protein